MYKSIDTFVGRSGRRFNYLLSIMLGLFFQLAMTLETSAGLPRKVTLILNKNSVERAEKTVEVITGTVTDEKGLALPGVSVKLKGSTIGVISGTDGKYSLKVPNIQGTLVFSFIGFVTQEIPLNNRRVINVTLKSQSSTLTEVVVVGYGTQKKVSMTSAVGSVKAEDVNKRVVSNFQQSLQGLAPGLTVLDQGGAPGRSTATMRIRGVTTLSGNNPLILVDGVEQGINNFNPEDVETVSVLKDAAATAIYGSRAAAGVILITTKRAKEGRATIGYSGYVGLQQLGNHPVHMSTEDYMRQQNVAYINAGQAAPYTEDSIKNYVSSPDKIKHPLANDWFNALYHTAPQFNNNLSIGGGSEQFLVNMNLRYMKQDGIVDNFSNDVKEVRLNTDFKPSSKIKLSGDAFYRMLYSTQPQDAGNVFYNTLHGAQFTVPRYPDGGYGVSAQGNSPLISDKLSGYDRDWYNYFSGNLRFEWQILKDLKFSTQYAITSSADRGKIYRNTYSVADENYPSRKKSVTVNNLTESRTNNYQETINSILEYNKQLGFHNIKVLGGYSQIYTRGDVLTGFRNTFYNNDIQALSMGANSSKDNSGSDSEAGLRSYFGRVNYNFNNKYLLEANGRYDGSSNFTGDNLYSFFPSFSAGWRLSQEPFWKGMPDVFSEFKLRGSWGKTGNQTVPAYSFYDALTASNYNFSGVAVTGYALTTYANKNLKWETTTQTDLGFDAGLLKNRLSVTFDYYNKKTTGILLQLPIPSMVGLSAPYQNAGVVSNKGWEVSLGYQGQSNELNYSFNFNISNNINKILDLKGTGPYISGSVSDALYVRNVGMPIDALWGFKTGGLYKDEADVNSSPKYDPNTKPGDVKYLDINNDQKITADDRTMVGDPYPHYSYGFTSNMQYKNFDLYFFLQGVVKQDARISGAFADAGNNQGFVIDIEKDYWTPENTDARFPRPQKFTDKNSYMSDFWVIRMGYLRLKNIQLGYTLPKPLLNKLDIKKVRFYLSGTNLFTISNANEWGIDPEFPSGRMNYYPQTRIYTIGVNASF